MDTTTEARLVGIIDQALSDATKARPVRSDVVDVLLDLRLLLLEVESLEQLLDEPAATPAG